MRFFWETLLIYWDHSAKKITWWGRAGKYIEGSEKPKEPFIFEIGAVDSILPLNYERALEY